MANSKSLSVLYFIATTITVALVLLYYHPHFLSVNNESVGSSLSRYVLIATAALCAMSFNFNKWMSSAFARKYILFLIAVGLVGIILSLFHVTGSYLHHARALLLPLMFFLTGYSMCLSRKQMRYVCIVFLLSAIYIGVGQVLTNIGSFVIANQYLVSAKNCISGLFSVGIVISFVYFLSDEETVIWKVFFMACMLMLLFILVTVRGRAGMLASFCTCAWLYIAREKKRGASNLGTKIFIALAVVVVGLLAFGHFFSYLSTYVYDSIFTPNTTGDITSGRTTRNLMALKVIFHSPLFGELADTGYENIGWVHNYLLLSLSEYGLLCGGVLAALYFFLIKTVWRGCRSYNGHDEMQIGYWIMMILLLISLFEPTYPYGPGTVSFFPFYVLGFTMQNEQQI